MRNCVRTIFFVALLFVTHLSQGQSELYIKKQNGARQKTLEIHRILNVATSYRRYSGYVVRLTDSTMVINEQYMKAGVKRDSLMHIPFDLITELEYCKSNDLLKCDKRRNKVGRTFISSALGVSTVIALIGLYGGSGYVFVAGAGASAILYTVGVLTNDRKHYNFNHKWSIVTQ